MRKLGILILAGGSSERFGGEKAFFEIDGEPMIQHVVKTVSKLSKEIVISCRSNKEKLLRMFPGAKILRDEYGRKGALTGLMSALPKIDSEYVALVTCDCPKISSGVIKFLFERAKNHDGAVPRWPNGYVEPLQAVYRTKGLRRAVSDAWRDGEMRLTEVLKRLRDISYVPMENIRKVDPKLESFVNVNSPEDIGLLFSGKP